MGKINKTRQEQEEEYHQMAQLNNATLLCKKCMGRGYTGWDIKYEFYIPCECLLKAAYKLEMKKLAEKETNEN